MPRHRPGERLAIVADVIGEVAASHSVARPWTRDHAATAGVRVEVVAFPAAGPYAAHLAPDSITHGALVEPIAISDATRLTAGILLLSIVAVEAGGLFMLIVVRRFVPATPFQLAFYRAGHAHAGVLVTLALATQLLVDAVTLDGIPAALARSGIAAAAILMPAGFFLSALGRERSRPNVLVVLIYAGALLLGAGAVSLGAGLLVG